MVRLILNVCRFSQRRATLGGFEVGNSRDLDMTPVVERSIATGEPILVVAPNYRLTGECSVVQIH